jgi:predicted porin
MKKSLLALALAGAFTGTAFAQTNLTIYGIADIGYTYFDNGVDSINRLDSGIQSGSRIGFRGSENLGSGLSAIFTLENGFNLDNGTFGQPTATGATRLFGRQAFVGLSSGFGAVKLGRQINPIRNSVEAIDPFAIGLAGNASNVFNVYGDRSDNTINYSLPSNLLGGVKGELAYSFGEQPDSTSLGRVWGGAIGYAGGPFEVTLAYHDVNLVTTGGDAGNAKTLFLGGTWDFRVVKLHAAYAKNEGETATGIDAIDSQDGMLGVSAPVGPGRILASYIRRKDDLVNARDADQWALGFTWDLSKRTNLYTSYAHTKNDGAGTLNGAAAPGEDPSTFNIGVRHRF